jgi:hypothetical protein
MALGEPEIVQFVRVRRFRYNEINPPVLGNRQKNTEVACWQPYPETPFATVPAKKHM